MGSVLRRVVVLFALAGAAWWFFDWAQAEDARLAQLPPASGPLFPGLEVGAVTAVHMTLDFGHDLALERELGGRWRITEPTKEWARADLVAQWLDNIARASYVPLDESGAALSSAELGLEPARHRFTITLADGREHTLLLGNPDPMGHAVYARGLGIDEIGLVTGNVVTLTRYHGEDWVDPNLLRGVVGGITRVKVVKPDGLLMDAVHEGGSWKLRGPVAALPDEDRISRMLRSLQFARTERVLASRPTEDELAKFGFPDEERVAAGDYGACTYLEVGNESEGSVHALLSPGWWEFSDFTPAKRGDGDKVLSIPVSALAMLRNTPDFFREHRLLPPVRERATSLRIEQDGEPVLDIRQGAQGLWSFHAPARLAGELLENERRFGRSALSALLGEIDSLEAESFVDAADLAVDDADRRLVVGWQHSGRTLFDSVRLGPPGADGRLTAVTSLRPEEGLVISAKVLALFEPLQADALRTLEPLRVDTDRWVELRIEGAPSGATHTIDREAGGAWRGDDPWGRRYGLAHDLISGLRGFHWQAARADAVYPAVIRFLDAAGGELTLVRLRPPADDEDPEAMGTPIVMATVTGFEGLELVVPALWLETVRSLDTAPVRR